MKTELLFDFSANKENKTVFIRREFSANLELVWKAWVTPEILEQWAAPKPWIAQTKTMDFRDGGFWLFAIVSPEGRKHWSRYDYKKIEFQKTIIELRAFSNEDGIVSPDFPRTECTTIFSEVGGNTIVTISAQYGNFDIFEKMASDGHKNGFLSTLKNLDKLLSNLKTIKNEKPTILFYR